MESAVAVADALLQVRLKRGDSLPDALARVQGQRVRLLHDGGLMA
jgi:hypothetical protein